MNELNPTNRLTRNSHVNRNNPTETKKNSNGKSDQTSHSDKVTLSSTSKEASKAKGEKFASEIRFDLVQKFKDVLSEGDYEVKSNEIADKIVQKIRENKNQTLLY